MITLTQIRAERAHAQACFDAAWAGALRLLSETSPGRGLAAELAGYRRELEALAKVEAELIANGKPSPISDLPSSIS